MQTTLYKQDVTGKIRVWEISIDGNALVMKHGLQGGAPQVKTETIAKGLANRTLEEQVKSRYYSRINKQYDIGYKDSVLSAKVLAGTNASGLHKPMLAQRIEKVKNIDYTNAFMQHKYDGHRCLITNQGGKKIAYSRKGKMITSIEHVLEELPLEDGATIDGELYCHGVPLQTLSSWIRMEQEASRNLKFHAYDVITDACFEQRFIRLDDLVQDADHSVLVPTTRVADRQEAFNHFINSRAAGFEGGILRWGDFGYEIGKRSKSLVKIKTCLDAEFPVIDIIASKDRHAILVCLGKNKTFKVLAPGSHREKEVILEEKAKYIGCHITVEFANYTIDGLPFHPVALRWREDV